MSILLTIGPEYSGGMYLYHNAEKSADLFEETMKSIFTIETIKLRGHEASSSNILKYINIIINRSDIQRVYIYYSGHGNNCGNKEFWQTSTGTIDQIKMAELINKSKPLVIVISDSCSSEHMVNCKLASHSFITLGATLDYQDAIMTGDGGLFTNILVECLKKITNETTFNDLFNLLEERSVEIEKFSFRYSSTKIIHEKIILQN